MAGRFAEADELAAAFQEPILGRVITAACGLEYRDFVTQRLLRPLGMTATGFADAEFGAKDLARGYQRGPEGWSGPGFGGYGAFAPMGGIFSCVADLAQWVAWLAAAFPPGRDAPGGDPLAAASRRDMQTPQVTAAAPPFTGPPPGPHPPWRAPQRGHGRPR